MIFSVAAVWSSGVITRHMVFEMQEEGLGRSQAFGYAEVVLGRVERSTNKSV